MSYSNIKRFMSVALLCAFALPSSLAVAADYNSYFTDNNSTALSGDVILTQKNDLITLSLRDSDVKQVLRMFADKAGMNIIFHSSVEGKVTLDLVQTPVNQAFNMVLQIAGLNYYKQGNTMIVMSKDSPDNASYSKQDMMVFPVKYVSASKIADFLNKNVFGMKKAGMSGGDAATVNSATNELIVFGMPSDMAIIKKVIEQFDREPYSKTFVVNHTTPAEMAKMICSFLLPSSGVVGGDSGQQMGSPANAAVTGGAASVSDSGSGSGSSSSIKIGEGIVACSASSGSSGSSGSVAPFDMQNLAVAYFPQRGTVSLMGGSESQIAMIERFIKKNDVKQPQAMLEVSIVELNEDGSKEFSNKWSFNSGNWIITSSKTGTGVNYSDKNEAQKGLSWTMNYLIENQKARVLANPKILITNGQESVIDLTQDYLEKTTTEYLNSGGSGTVGVAQKTYTIGEDLGIKVSLTPFISPEGYVTLNVKPDYSSIAGKIYAEGEVVGATDLVGTLLKRRNLDLKNVRIKDGETLVIGGLIQESDTKTVNKVPILGDLPIVGAAFRSTSSTKSKSELVVMLTPKIIYDGEGAVADSL